MESGETKSNQPSLVSQGAWLFVAKFIGFALSFLLPLITVRYLSQDKVGVYRQAFQVITDAVAILPFGFNMAAYYFLPRETVRKNSVIFNILLFNFVVGGIACLGFFLFPQVIGDFANSQNLTELAPKMGLVVWIWIFGSFLETVALANQETRIATIFIVLAQLSKTVLMSGAVVFWGTVEAFIYAAMVQGIIQTLILLFYLKSRFPKFWRSFDPAFFREQFIYILPFGCASLLFVFQFNIHNYFVMYRFGDTEYAIYAYGCFQLPLISMLAESVISVLLPRMSELQTKNDTAEMIRLTARAMQKLSLFYFPIYLFFMITAHTFVVTLFTKQYEASVPIFMINLTILPYQILVTDPIVRAYSDLGKKLLLIRVCLSISLVTIMLMYISSMSLTDVISVVVIFAFIEKTIAETIIIRRIGFKLSDLHQIKNVGKVLIVNLLAAAVTYLFYQYSIESLLEFWRNLIAPILSNLKPGYTDFFVGCFALGVIFLVYATIYGVGLYAWNLLDEQEKTMIQKVVGKIAFRNS